MVDSCIEALILRGAIQMGRFLEDGPAVIDCIRWHAGDGSVLQPLSTARQARTHPAEAPVSACPFGVLAQRSESTIAFLFQRFRQLASALRTVSKRALYLAWMYAMNAVRWLFTLLRRVGARK